jgi:hypothetical protein
VNKTSGTYNEQNVPVVSSADNFLAPALKKEKWFYFMLNMESKMKILL